MACVCNTSVRNCSSMYLEEKGGSIGLKRLLYDDEPRSCRGFGCFVAAEGTEPGGEGPCAREACMD